MNHIFFHFSFTSFFYRLKNHIVSIFIFFLKIIPKITVSLVTYRYFYIYIAIFELFSFISWGDIVPYYLQILFYDSISSSFISEYSYIFPSLFPKGYKYFTEKKIQYLYTEKKKKSFRMTSDTLPRRLFSPERTGRFLALGCKGVIFTRISRRLRRSNGYHSNAEYAKTDTHIARPRFYYILFRYVSLSLSFLLPLSCVLICFSFSVSCLVLFASSSVSLDKDSFLFSFLSLLLYFLSYCSFKFFSFVVSPFFFVISVSLFRFLFTRAQINTEIQAPTSLFQFIY